MQMADPAWEAKSGLMDEVTCRQSISCSELAACGGSSHRQISCDALRKVAARLACRLSSPFCSQSWGVSQQSEPRSEALQGTMRGCVHEAGQGAKHGEAPAA